VNTVLYQLTNRPDPQASGSALWAIATYMLRGARDGLPKSLAFDAVSSQAQPPRQWQ
jgi:hypothetical protein